MSLPKVLVVTTTYEKKDYCFKEFMEHVSKLTYPNMKHIFIDNSKNLNYANKLRRRGVKAIHIERGNNTREAIARSCNYGRKLALEGNYDYMFMLESDVMPPPNIIENLMIQAKDVITGLYYIGDKHKGQRVPCITIEKWNDQLMCWGTRLLKVDEFDDWINKGVKQCQAGSFGCCLISKNILQKFGFYYCHELNGHPDIYFFNELRNNKRQVFVHTDLICGHDNKPWKNVVDR